MSIGYYSSACFKSQCYWILFTSKHCAEGGRGAGVGKLHKMAESTADVLGLDWSTDMAEARAALGPDRVLQGNVDPALLFASEVSCAPVPSPCPCMLQTPGWPSKVSPCIVKFPERQMLSSHLFS